MTIPIKKYTDSEGIEMVQLKKSDYEKLIHKVHMLEATIKVAKGIENGIKDMKSGKVSPVENLFI